MDTMYEDFLKIIKDKAGTLGKWSNNGIESSAKELSDKVSRFIEWKDNGDCPFYKDRHRKMYLHKTAINMFTLSELYNYWCEKIDKPPKVKD